MPLAPFFERIYSALGGHLAVSRDDLSAALHGVTVGVACGDRVSHNDSWIGELSTNLLARLYPRIAINGPEQQAASLRNIALSINPDIEIVAAAPEHLTIGIGKGTLAAALFPSASGWVAKLGCSQHESGPTNPYSAGAAATFAAAELFRRIFLKSISSDDVSVSLLNFDKTSGAELDLPSSNLGDVLFVAVGAVGNAAIWALARDARRQGHFILIDNEQLELSNLQRYVLANYGDVSKQKVSLGREVLGSGRIAVETVTETLESFSEMNGGIRTPTLCISVDNIASRRAAQALLPKLVINGWTGDRALGASWHVFSREAACLACLYQPHGEGVSQTEQAARALGLMPERAALLWVTRLPLSDDDIATAADKLGVPREILNDWRGRSLGDLYSDVVCGAVPISLAVTSRVETVPLAHQSALAGILMSAELVKRTTPELALMSQTEPLVSWDDVLLPPPPIWGKPRARERGCICGDPDYQMTYRSKWSN